MEAEIEHLRQILNQGHYLQAGRPAGHVLWQGIYRTDTESDCPELVAVLCWGGAEKRLKERDNHIGRDTVTCANRLKLIVQLRRFCVIDSARRPNLPSQCLGLSLRTLRGEYEARHGFAPLMAESFHDPEEHTGTLHKATNWLSFGHTKGFKRHRLDFYQDTEKPKHLWIRPQKRNPLLHHQLGTGSEKCLAPRASHPWPIGQWKTKTTLLRRGYGGQAGCAIPACGKRMPPDRAKKPAEAKSSHWYAEPSCAS